jgi:hypothetical protein
MAKISPSSPLFPTKYVPQDHRVFAVQAVSRGEATEEQQRVAIKFIIEDICLTYDEPYRPDSERDTTFALGKRHAGMEIVKFIKLKMGKIK